MASDPEAAAPQTEIIAKSQFDLWSMLPVIMPITLAIVAVLLLSGIRDALGLLVIVFASVSFALLMLRYHEPQRAVFDDEGMTLLPRGVSRLHGRAVRFRWEEVLEVRRQRFLEDSPLRILLNRPRAKFWTFTLRQPNLVLIPKGISQNPQFDEAIRAHVPAERVRMNPAFDERRSWAARHWWIFFLVIFICAGVAARCSFSIGRGEGFVLILMAAIAYVMGWLTMMLCAQRASPAFRLIGGLTGTLAFLSPASLLLAFYFPRGLVIISGCMGAAAGLLVGAAIMVIHGKKSPTWRGAGAALLLAAAGFWAGWSNSHQVSGVRLGSGSLEYRSPWTPKGDAFLMTEGVSYGNSIWPKQVCWYSSGGEPEYRVALPSGARLVAAGEEAALFKFNREPTPEASKPTAQLWLVPRRPEPRVIDEASDYGNATMSCDFRKALIPVFGEERWPLAWKICDLQRGLIEPVKLPVPPKEVLMIALRAEETLVWLTGSRPFDKGKNLVTSRTPLPESGEFPYPGELYRIWAWRIGSPEPPAQIYAARTQWLEWRRGAKPGQLYVCRISEKPPAHVEFVALYVTQSPPVEAAISEEKFDEYWRLLNRSHDGRFDVVKGQSNLFPPAFIVDTASGKKFSLPLMASLPLQWSPSANKFLMEVPELKRAGTLWIWHRSPEESIEYSWTVYLVDMDRQ